MIRVENLVKRYGKLEALTGISASFERGQVVAIVGPNASGKTTLIKCLLSMVIPDGGTIFFNNQNIAGTFSYKEHIGYMPQIGRYPENMKMGYLFTMMKDLRNKTSAGIFDEILIESFELRSMFNKTMHSLSGGTRQKVSAALALLFHPDVLILDEPTAGLDPLAAGILKQKLLSEKKMGKLILITSHIMSEVEELADDVLYLNEGKVSFYKPVAQLRLETGEERLGNALLKILT